MMLTNVLRESICKALANLAVTTKYRNFGAKRMVFPGQHSGLGPGLLNISLCLAFSSRLEPICTKKNVFPKPGNAYKD